MVGGKFKELGNKAIAELVTGHAGGRQLKAVTKRRGEPHLVARTKNSVQRRLHGAVGLYHPDSGNCCHGVRPAANAQRHHSSKNVARDTIAAGDHDADGLGRGLAAKGTGHAYETRVEDRKGGTTGNIIRCRRLGRNIAVWPTAELERHLDEPPLI